MTATYSIKNTGSVDKAFKVRGGHQILAAGKEGEVTMPRPLDHEQIDALARDGVKVTKKGSTKTVDEAPAGPQAVHRGAGSYSILDGDKELVEKLSKEEADSFNKLDADAKAAFITNRTKAQV